MRPLYADRIEAGRQLAERLRHLKGQDPVVLALPRGGVPVGVEIAHALEAPLDLLIVRKIGAPHQPELALGAVVNGSGWQTILNQDLVAALAISDDFLRKATARELREIRRRRRVYLAGRDAVPVAGRSAIVVDDGIATGASIRAALLAVRRKKPKRLVLAVPVAPGEVMERLSREVDEAICLASPEPFFAIGPYYADFTQVSDREVTKMMDDLRAAA
jgi:putative phosphoribosyl transferase